MNEKRFARLKQLCSETGNGDYSTDAEWGELALDLTHDMVAEIARLREALASVANFGGAHIEVGEGSGKTIVWDEPSYGQTNIAIETLLKGGGDGTD